MSEKVGITILFTFLIKIILASIFITKKYSKKSNTEVYKVCNT